MSDKAKGTCYCGNIEFEIILPVKNVINCHCNMCRRLSGADYTTWVSVSKESLTMTKGREKLSEFQITSQSTQTFCTVCGTRITTESSIYPTVVGLLRGIIEGEIHCNPSGNYFVSDKAPWVKICTGLPNHGDFTGIEPEAR
jgi:hypothetical protein